MTPTPPPLNYNNFTIILGKSSRFDKQNNKLLSGNAGSWFKDQINKNGINIHECNITVANENNIPASTTTIFLLGIEALRLFKQDVSLGEQRGSPFTISLPTGRTVVCICSFAPQDAFDPRNYEDKFNKEENEGGGKDEREDTEISAKTHGRTNRGNYRFWLSKDIDKICRIHKDGGKLNIVEPSLYIYPSQEEVITELLKHKGKDFTIDIETNPETCDITVLSFCFTDKEDAVSIPLVWVIPVWLYNYTIAYENIYRIFACIAVAMRDNRTVHHNGSGYDLFIFGYRYGLPFGIEQFDTMLSHHRCYPEQEKSLGHLISLYTDFPYHKNTAGTYVPHSAKQEYDLWVYNGADVHTTLYVKRAIEKYAAAIDAEESVEQVNRSIYPYLTMTFMGIRVDQEGVDKKIAENDRRINQLLRVLNILVGRNINPRSNKDMPHYLYSKKDKGGLGLTIPHYTPDNNPACDATAIIKLFLKNPKVITLRVILEIRRVQDESKALIFKPISW